MSTPQFTPLTHTFTGTQFNHSHWDGHPDFRTQDEFFGNRTDGAFANPIKLKVKELLTHANIHIPIIEDKDSDQDQALGRQFFRFLILEDGQENQETAIVELKDQVKALSMQLQQLGQQFKGYKDATDAKLELKSREIERLSTNRV